MTACVSLFDMVGSVLFGLDIAETTVSTHQSTKNVLINFVSLVTFFAFSSLPQRFIFKFTMFSFYLEVR